MTVLIAGEPLEPGARVICRGEGLVSIGHANRPIEGIVDVIRGNAPRIPGLDLGTDAVIAVMGIYRPTHEVPVTISQPAPRIVGISSNMLVFVLLQRFISIMVIVVAARHDR